MYTTSNSDPETPERFSAMFERLYAVHHHGPKSVHHLVVEAAAKQDLDVIEYALRQDDLWSETLTVAEQALRAAKRHRGVTAVLKHPSVSADTLMQHLPYATPLTLAAGLNSRHCPEEWLLEASVHVTQRHLTKVVDHPNATEAVRTFVETLH